MTRAASVSNIGDGSAAHRDRDQAAGRSPGKRTLVEQLPAYAPTVAATTTPAIAAAAIRPSAEAAPVQRMTVTSGSLPRLQLRDVAATAGEAPSIEAHVQAPEATGRAAELGTSGAAGALPHHDRIQAAFGRHDLSGVHAFVGGTAAEGAARMGAQAFATADKVAFSASPDLHTAAHEAAHVVQQRAGVQLKGGVGQAGDRYERHADAVADQVVQGHSAEALLDTMAGGHRSGGDSGVVQRMIIPIGDLASPTATPEQQREAQIIKKSTKRLRRATDDTVARLDPAGVHQPLDALDDTEELTIVAHGGVPDGTEVAETYGGHGPVALAALLVANGLKPSYAGTIYLNGCNTTAASEGRTSYAERFQAALLSPHEIRVAVRGNQRGSRVLKDGETGFDKDERERQEVRELYEAVNAQFRQTRDELARLTRICQMPHLALGDAEILSELELPKDASAEEIKGAAHRLALSKVQADEAASVRLKANCGPDALHELRPDLITTLPRPPSDSVFLGTLMAKVFGVLALAMAAALQIPPPLGNFVFLLAVAFVIYMTRKALRGRPG